MTNRILLTGIVLLTTFLPVFSQSFQTTQYAVGTQLSNNTLLYGLPKTSLKADVVMVKTVFRKGPFADFAQKYLQMNVNKQDIEKWQIASVSLSEHYAMDPEHYYVITFRNLPKNIERLITLTKEGTVLDMSMSGFLASGEFAPAEVTAGFKNMVIENPLVQSVDTVFKVMLKDTAFVREPVVIKKIQHMPKEDQAKELARQIFELRQRKNDLLNGDSDDIPDAETLKLMLEKVDIQEKELLTMFTGVSMDIPVKKTFTCTPDKDSEKAFLFYFSEQKGLSVNKEGSTEVFLQFKKLGEVSVNNLELVNPKSPAKGKKGQEFLRNAIYYRVPAQIETSVIYNGTSLTSKQIPIYQMGELTSVVLEAK